MKKNLNHFLNFIFKRRLIIVVFLLVVLTPVTYTLSRYVTDAFTNSYLNAKHFYFNSDKLTDDHEKYIINNWSGVEDFVIEISLDSKKNELEAAPMDINYEISVQCEEKVTCSLSKTEGIIYSSTNEDKVKLSVVPKVAFASDESTKITVSATSKSPYIKTISADFVMEVGKKGVSYDITDSSINPYFMVNITNAISFYKVKNSFGDYNVGDLIDGEDYLKLSDAEKENCVSTLITLTFDPTIVILDTTHEIMQKYTSIKTTNIDGMNYISSITFPMEAMSSDAVRFYKKNKSENYTYPIVNKNPVVELKTE